MKAILTLLLLFALSHICCSAVETDLPTTWKVGIATADITPGQPIRMAGYGGRKKPSQGTVEALHAKAITFEDNKGNRSVMVTLDLIGVIAELRKQVAAEVQKNTKLHRMRCCLMLPTLTAAPLTGAMMPKIISIPW